MLGKAEGSLISQIWRVSNETGAVELVTNDVNNYTGLSVARSTGEIVSVKAEPQSKLWITREEDSHQATAVPFSSLAGLSGIAWTADNRLIYTATDDRTLNLWTMDLNGNSKKQLTNAGSNILPVVSPDGRYIVFMSDRNGGSNHLWRMEFNDGELLELTHGEEDQFPSFSPDGKWIVYTQVEAGKWYAARVSIDGGNSSRLSSVPAMCPVVSPDGKQIALLIFDNYLAKPAVMPFEGGNPTKTFDFIVPLVGSKDVSYLVRWTHDSKAIELAKDDHGVSNLWRLPLDGGTPKQITDFNTDHIFYFSRSPDGKEIALARGSISSDAVKISDLN
jgi:Tol biopolymer transport system component